MTTELCRPRTRNTTKRQSENCLFPWEVSLSYISISSRAAFGKCCWLTDIYWISSIYRACSGKFTKRQYKWSKLNLQLFWWLMKKQPFGDEYIIITTCYWSLMKREVTLNLGENMFFRVITLFIIQVLVFLSCYWYGSDGMKLMQLKTNNHPHTWKKNTSSHLSSLKHNFAFVTWFWRP